MSEAMVGNPYRTPAERTETRGPRWSSRRARFYVRVSIRLGMGKPFWRWLQRTDLPDDAFWLRLRKMGADLRRMHSEADKNSRRLEAVATVLEKEKAMIAEMIDDMGRPTK